MINKSILYGVVGLVVGVVFSGLVFSKQASNSQPALQTQTNMSHDMSKMTSEGSMTMDDMVGSLKGKTGDDFDKAFLSGMIEHHQGAIDMAKEAQENAKHDEIKKMAQDIISAQTSEIDVMKQWQKEWGY